MKFFKFALEMPLEENELLLFWGLELFRYSY